MADNRPWHPGPPIPSPPLGAGQGEGFLTTMNRFCWLEVNTKEGILAGIAKATEMKPEAYLTYFEDFIFAADKESG